MKLVNEALKKMRKQVGVKVKGSRFLLLKNSQDLTELETEQLEQLLNQSACLRIAYEMKEGFRVIPTNVETL
jgi:hypothetical protein